MRKIVIIFLVLVASIHSIAQDGVFSRVIAKQSFFLRNTWIDSLRRDTVGWENDYASLPTSAAVYKFVLAHGGGGSGDGIRSLGTTGNYGLTRINDSTYKFDSATVFPQIRSTISTSNMANANLTQTAARTYAGAGFNYTLNDLGHWDFNMASNKNFTVNNAYSVTLNSSTNNWAMNGNSGAADGVYIKGEGDVFFDNALYIYSGLSATRNSEIRMYPDSISIRPGGNGKINLDSLRDGATYNMNKLIGWGSGSKVVGAVTIGSGLDLTSGVLTSNSNYVDTTFIKVANYTADQKRGNVLGTLYEQTGFSTLDTFALSGTTTPTISNSMILLGGGGTDGRAILKRYTMLNRWSLKSGFKVGQKNGTSYGLGIGVLSANTTFTQSIRGFINLRSTPSQYDGFIELADGTSSFNNLLASSATAVSFSVGDSIEVTLQRNVNIFTFTARNVTTDGAPVSVSYTYTGLTTAVNTGRPFIESAGIDSVYYMNFYSSESKSADLITIGDSKFTWYGNSINEAIPSQMYALDGNVINHSGSGDKTLEVTLTTPEIIALTPRQALVNIGSNDIRSGISSGTWQANIDTIYNRLTAAGITVYFSLAYEAAISQTALVTYLTSTYPTRYIRNGYDTTYNCTSCLLSDNIHLTSYGDSIWVDAIGQSGMIDFASSGSGGYTNLTQFVSQTPWRIFYSNGSGDVTELALGSSGKVLTTNGASSAPTWETPSAGGTTWNAITDPTGDQALTFQAGESSTWTDQNTTEDLFTINDATSTTKSIISLNRTSTALTVGNNMMEIISSGANAANPVTATGLSISVTNTNVTAGTNIGLNVTASGATTGNYAALFSGRVGMGTPTPQTLLQVGGASGSTAFGTAAQLTVSNNGSATYINLLGPSSVEMFMGAEAVGGIVGTITNDPFIFRTNNTARMTVAAAGGVTVASLAGTGDRAVLADANGLLSAPVSDRSVKENIQSLNYGLNTIMKLNPVSFEYKDGWKNHGEGMQIGFIAQDIQKVLPNSAFTTPTTGKMGYNEIDLVPILVRGMQEQQDEIENLKKEVNRLKRKR